MLYYSFTLWPGGRTRAWCSGSIRESVPVRHLLYFRTRKGPALSARGPWLVLVISRACNQRARRALRIP